MRGERDFFETVGVLVQSTVDDFAPRNAKLHSIARHTSKGNDLVITDGGQALPGYEIYVQYNEGDLVYSDGRNDYIHDHNGSERRFNIPCRLEKITR